MTVLMEVLHSRYVPLPLGQLDPLSCPALSVHKAITGGVLSAAKALLSAPAEHKKHFKPALCQCHVIEAAYRCVRHEAIPSRWYPAAPGAPQDNLHLHSDEHRCQRQGRIGSMIRLQLWALPLKPEWFRAASGALLESVALLLRLIPAFALVDQFFDPLMAILVFLQQNHHCGQVFQCQTALTQTACVLSSCCNTLSPARHSLQALRKSHLCRSSSCLQLHHS